MEDVFVLIRWTDNALGVTGWGWFWLCMFFIAIMSIGDRKK